MIAEAQKQPQETRRTATIETFATTSPEAQSYLKDIPATTVTQGNTGVTVDGNTSILKNEHPAGPQMTIPSQVKQTVPRMEQKSSAPSYASLFRARSRGGECTGVNAAARHAPT